MSRTLPRIAASIGAIVLAAGTGAAAYALVDSDSTETVRTVATGVSTASSSGLSVSQIYQRAHEGVVEITVTTQASGGGQAQGSGFVYDEDGHVVTNHHVVDGASTAPSRFCERRARTTRPSSAPTPRPTSRCSTVDAPASRARRRSRSATRAELAVGDGVVAIGSPFGLEETVTTGIVSALDRQMEAPNGFTINDSIQTDAAINHGNSGGPLLNLEGDVVGVNAQIASESGGNDGVGFAIPSNTVDDDRRRSSSPTATSSTRTSASRVAHDPASATASSAVAAGVAVAEVREDTPGRARRACEAGTGTTTVDGAPVPDRAATWSPRSTARRSRPPRISSARSTPTSPATRSRSPYVRGGDTRTVDVTLDSRPS